MTARSFGWEGRYFQYPIRSTSGRDVPASRVRRSGSPCNSPSPAQVGGSGRVGYMSSVRSTAAMFHSAWNLRIRPITRGAASRSQKRRLDGLATADFLVGVGSAGGRLRKGQPDHSDCSHAALTRRQLAFPPAIGRLGRRHEALK